MTNDRLHMVRTAAEGLQALAAVETVIENSSLDKMLMHLVKLRISLINGCVYCVSLHNTEAREDGETQDRLDHIVVWQDTNFYSDSERAALAWGEALTLRGNKADLDSLHKNLQEHLSDEDIGTLMLVVVMINTWNRIQMAAHASTF
ncbi:MAG: carboxymuconolactone decarboxylase family protein [Gammaproteobacteria bacterium]|nr:carboxymuconolactone decarboxylase family protein [Gammaproteobacteria bacterium]